MVCLMDQNSPMTIGDSHGSLLVARSTASNVSVGSWFLFSLTRQLVEKSHPVTIVWLGVRPGLCNGHLVELLHQWMYFEFIPWHNNGRESSDETWRVLNTNTYWNCDLLLAGSCFKSFTTWCNMQGCIPTCILAWMCACVCNYIYIYIYMHDISIDS